MSKSLPIDRALNYSKARRFLLIYQMGGIRYAVNDMSSVYNTTSKLFYEWVQAENIPPSTWVKNVMVYDRKTDDYWFEAIDRARGLKQDSFLAGSTTLLDMANLDAERLRPIHHSIKRRCVAHNGIRKKPHQYED